VQLNLPARLEHPTICQTNPELSLLIHGDFQLLAQMQANKIATCSGINHKSQLLIANITTHTNDITTHMLRSQGEATQAQFFGGGGGGFLLFLLGKPFNLKQSFFMWPYLPQW
jgi:hypothetical protein